MKNKKIKLLINFQFRLKNMKKKLKNGKKKYKSSKNTEEMKLKD